MNNFNISLYCRFYNVNFYALTFGREKQIKEYYFYGRISFNLLSTADQSVNECWKLENLKKSTGNLSCDIILLASANYYFIIIYPG